MHFNDKILYQAEIGNVEYKLYVSFLMNFVFFIAYLSSPLYLLLYLCILFITISIHEAGHALVARFFNYRVYSINLRFGGGTCTHEECYYARHDILIAWGGVGAQLLSLLPVVLLWFVLGKTTLIRLPLISFLVSKFIWYNFITIVFNLLPVPGLDGEKAWSFITDYIRFKRDIELFKQTEFSLDRKRKKKKSPKTTVYKELNKQERAEARRVADEILKSVGKPDSKK